jgi:hypothetical protein
VRRQTVLQIYGTPLRALGSLTPERGWALTEDRLLLTADGGARWRDATPEGLRILGVTFTDPQKGWAVGRPAPAGELAVARTTDGGLNWSIRPLPVDEGTLSAPVEAAYIDVPGEGVAWVTLRLQSGASFSLGRLFVTVDGGRTWSEREVPMGEPVTFLDTRRGWVTGGPAGDLFYRTRDGGRTWERQPLDIPTGGYPSVGRPYFENDREGWLPVLLGEGEARQVVLFTSRDGGRSWRRAPSVGRTTAISAEALSRADLASEAGIWASVGVDLPQGAVAVDFADDRHGWALVQRGRCEAKVQSEDRPSAAAGPVRCEQIWALLATEDGGASWREIALPE